MIDDNGICFDDLPDLCRITENYFQNLFSSTEAAYEPVISVVDTKLSAENNDLLLAPFSQDEFKAAVFQMHPDKSPGPDGFNPAFFQKF